MDNEQVIMKENNEGVMLLFSGGYGSVLAADRLASKGTKVYLITFDNECIKSIDTRNAAAKMLMDKFNTDSVQNIVDLGVENIYGIWQMIARPILTMSYTAMGADYGAMSHNQTDYLVLRSAMLAAAAIKCKSHNINMIAVGDISYDYFAAQHTETFDIHSSMLKDLFNLEYKRPIWDVKDELDILSELSLRSLPTCFAKPRNILISDKVRYDVTIDTHLPDKACSSMFSKVLYSVIESMWRNWETILNN